MSWLLLVACGTGDPVDPDGLDDLFLGGGRGVEGEATALVFLGGP